MARADTSIDPIVGARQKDEPGAREHRRSRIAFCPVERT
jgi:hypothetical protein